MTRIAGRYQITATLGEGGMGVVYRAYDPAPMDREVAVKTLHQFTDPMALQLFYKECSALKSISHPNIVEIFDIGEFEDEGQRKPFFVMPLLPGQTLEQLIRNASHRLTVERVVEIIVQTCRGLQAAHDRGLVHRDLKPSNIFVMSDDSVKIIDFGIVHAVNVNTRSAGFDKGTLIYMAPEQLQHKPVSVQSDVYALGVTAYEALTRRQPFRGGTYDEVTRAILSSIPPPASELNPAVSAILSRVVHRAMAKQPWNRYDSAREFAETLLKALRNEPIALFDPARLQPRIQTASRALEKGDYQFAGEIVTELEAEGNIDPQITLLRTQIDQIARQKTIAQLLDSARARYEESEDPLALQKLQEVLQLDPGNVTALGLKAKIEERRSDQQIERWMQLARQHIDNHSYGHAREALQNALVLRPRETRAARLLKEIEAEEQEYVRLRQEKTELYQAAVNAWKNGEISQALSQMKLVLDLDRRAPETASPDGAGVYHSFYNKIRSEHDAVNSGYGDARRCLAERDFPRALDICRSFLERYPGHALFQALKYDIEEQQRQQLSAFIADVERQLEAEPALDTKVSLLREAVGRYPDEGHFARLLGVLESKRQLVNSIVERARIHEERGLVQEALNDLDTLQTIYGAYPGLTYERERLQKRLEQQARSGAKARWVRQIDQQLNAANFGRAIELVDAACAEFPDEAEFDELRKLAAAGLERAGEADRLAAAGQAAYAEGRFDDAVDLFVKALAIDDRSHVRQILCDIFTQRGERLLAADWRAAEACAIRALEFDGQHAAARSLRARAADQKREELVAQHASEARRLQAAGDIGAALLVVERGLEQFPGEPRLRAVLDALTAGSDPRRTSLSNIAAAETVAVSTSLANQPRTVVPVAAPSVRVVSADDETRFIEATTPVAVASPVPVKPQGNAASSGGTSVAPTARGVSRGLIWGAAAVVIAAIIGLPFLRSAAEPPREASPSPESATAEAAAPGVPPVVDAAAHPSGATLALSHLPPETTVLLDNVAIGATRRDGVLSHTGIAPGRHTIQLVRAGFEPTTITREFAAGGVSTVDGRELTFRPAAIDIQFLADGTTEVTVSNGAETLHQFSGSRTLALVPGSYQVSARGTAGAPVTEPLTIAANGTRTVDFRHLPSGFEKFDSVGWTRNESWFTRRGGGFVLYDRASPESRITFTIRPDRSRNPFSSGPRIKWVVDFLDPRNYLLVELGDDYLYRTEVVDGTRRELPRVAHKIRPSGDFVHLSVAVSPSQIVHQFNIGAGWSVIDTLNRPTAAGGRFGFYVPGNETLELSNFRYDAARARQ